MSWPSYIWAGCLMRASSPPRPTVRWSRSNKKRVRPQTRLDILLLILTLILILILILFLVFILILVHIIILLLLCHDYYFIVISSIFIIMFFVIKRHCLGFRDQGCEVTLSPVGVSLPFFCLGGWGGGGAGAVRVEAQGFHSSCQAAD